jgi:hypothetical protein
MENILVYAKIGACIAITLVGIFASLLIHHASSLVMAQKQYEDASKTALSIYSNQVMADEHTLFKTINDPCTGFHGNVTCGILAQLSQTEKNTGILAAQGAEQVKQSGTLITSAVDAVTVLAGKSGDAIVSIKGVADQATTDLKTTNTLIKGAQPLVGHLDETVVGATKVEASLNDFLTDKTMLQLRQNLTDTTGTFSHMLVTADAVETKSTHNYLHPSTNPVKRSWQVVSPFLLPAAQGTAAALTLVAK